MSSPLSPNEPIGQISTSGTLGQTPAVPGARPLPGNQSSAATGSSISASDGPPATLGPPPSGFNAQIGWENDDGQVYSMPVRVKKVGHNFEVISDESFGRMSRGFYPKARAIGRFALTFEFVGYAAVQQFTRFIVNYIRNVLDRNRDNAPFMVVDILAPDIFPGNGSFIRRCVPVSGMVQEAEVAKIVYSPTLMFESMDDPLDPAVWWSPENWGSRISAFDLAHFYEQVGTAIPESLFWYPPVPEASDPNYKPTPEELYNAPPQLAPTPPPPADANNPNQKPPPAPPPPPPAKAPRTIGPLPGPWFGGIARTVGDIIGLP